MTRQATPKDKGEHCNNVVTGADELHDDGKLTPADLLTFAWQIAKGMVYIYTLLFCLVVCKVQISFSLIFCKLEIIKQRNCFHLSKIVHSTTLFQGVTSVC